MGSEMPEPLYILTESPLHGLGLFAARRIRKGTKIIEYVGERIDEEEANRRYDDESMEHHHTFLFSVNDEEIIDAAVDGNDARFINHSCDPNAEAVLEGDRIFIIATRTIRPGEEITYDYQLERDDTPEELWYTLYACHCGAVNCRRTILDSHAA